MQQRNNVASRVNTQNEPFLLNDIKTAMACKALEKGFFQPLRSFFQRMELEWGESQTAHAHLRKGKPIITLGRVFFTENVLSVIEAAEIVLHEIMEHAFGHFRTEACPYAGKYSRRIIGLARDALINAYLADVDCASFMERYYEDKDETAFLRPNSRSLNSCARVESTSGQKGSDAKQEKHDDLFGHEGSEGVFGNDSLWSMIDVYHSGISSWPKTSDQSGSMSDIFAHEVPHRLPDLHVPGNDLRFRSQFKKIVCGEYLKVEIGPDLAAERREFYERLQELEVPLEEALDFFEKHFGKQNQQEGSGATRQPLLGSHDQEQAASAANDLPTPPGDPTKSPVSTISRGEAATADQAMPESDTGNIFKDGEALDILRSFGIADVSKKSQDNFARVIRSIVELAKRQGEMRSGKRLARRMPAKITNDNLLSIERGRDLFSRPTFSAREYAIFLDVSGSVDRFIPFVNGLVRSLRAAERPVRCFVWADRVEELPVSKLGTDEQPNVGFGTKGQAVARFIAGNGVRQAVVITDNIAGPITTPIAAQVTLCLFPDSVETGSFLDKTVVPRCKKHKLEVDDDVEPDAE